MDQEPRDPFHLELSADEAMVFLEFLSRFSDSDRLTIDDPSEEQTLWKLCGQLERRLPEPLSPRYAELLARARERVRREDAASGA